MPTLKLVFWNETWQSHLPEFERWTPLYPDSLRPDGYRGSSSAAASRRRRPARPRRRRRAPLGVGGDGAAEALLQLAAQLRRRPARLYRGHRHGVEEGAALGRAADRPPPTHVYARSRSRRGRPASRGRGPAARGLPAPPSAAPAEAARAPPPRRPAAWTVIAQWLQPRAAAGAPERWVMVMRRRRKVRGHLRGCYIDRIRGARPRQRRFHRTGSHESGEWSSSTGSISRQLDLRAKPTKIVPTAAAIALVASRVSGASSRAEPHPAPPWSSP